MELGQLFRRVLRQSVQPAAVTDVADAVATLPYISHSVAHVHACCTTGGKPHLLFDGGQNQMKKFPKVWLTPR